MVCMKTSSKVGSFVFTERISLLKTFIMDLMSFFDFKDIMNYLPLI